MRGRCIFEYQFIPGRGPGETRVGYSVCVYSRGDMVKRDDAPGSKEPPAETVLASSPEAAVKIRAFIRRHAAKLKALPGSLDNAPVNGCVHRFTFGRKTISSREILRTDISEFSTHIPYGYEGFIEHRENQNAVLDLYDEIAAEINRHSAGFQLPVM